MEYESDTDNEYVKSGTEDDISLSEYIDTEILDNNKDTEIDEKTSADETGIAPYNNDEVEVDIKNDLQGLSIWTNRGQREFLDVSHANKTYGLRSNHLMKKAVRVMFTHMHAKLGIK